MPKGSSYTPEWIIVLIYIHGTLTAKEILERTNIQRTRAYLTKLIKEGKIKRLDRGLYTVDSGYIFEQITKLFDETYLTKEEIELLKKIITSPVVLDYIKNKLRNVQLSSLLYINPYAFFLQQTYIFLKGIVLKIVLELPQAINIMDTITSALKSIKFPYNKPKTILSESQLKASLLIIINSFLTDYLSKISLFNYDWRLKQSFVELTVEILVKYDSFLSLLNKIEETLKKYSILYLYILGFNEALNIYEQAVIRATETKEALDKNELKKIIEHIIKVLKNEEKQ